MKLRRWGLFAVLLLLAAGLGEAARAAEDSSAKLQWLDDLAQAQARAQQQQEPIIVYGTASWCTWCRKLEQQMQQPAAHEQLARWTRVRVDVDQSPQVAQQLGLATLPALRIMTPGGRVIASRNGYVDATELAQWLAAHHQQARAEFAAELLPGKPPTPAQLEKILAELQSGDAVAREAAIARLRPHAVLAASAIVELFIDGSLSTRLAAIELLESWQAPVQGLDPWRPALLSEQRAEQLRAWAAGLTEAPVATQPALSEPQLRLARRDVDALLAAATDTEAQAIRERLAALGEALLPEVYARLQQSSEDHARARLTALRYRIVASPQLALSWMSGLDRLASSHMATRHAALDELATRVTAGDSRLLIELFSDPDALIRERSLQLIQAVGGEEATAALVALLHDPEPNVRAAVLKQLATTPQPSLVPQIAQYAAQETDSDLVVHAVRVLRETDAPSALEALKNLLAHESWRVRAEVVDGIREKCSRYGRVPPEEKARVYSAMIRLLDDDDSFVVSRAAIALSDAGVHSALEPLINAISRNPQLAREVLKGVVGDEATGKAALPHLRQLAGHESMVVRAAAIEAVVQVAPRTAGKEIRAGLDDTEAVVRIAAAAALEHALKDLRPDDGYITRSSLLRGETRQAIDAVKWLEEHHQGKHLPRWAPPLAQPLQTMLQSGETEERLAAARALVALKHDPAAIDLIRQAIDRQPEARAALTEVLPWLAWEQRRELAGKLMAHGPSKSELWSLARNLVVIPDPRAADLLWDLLQGDDVETLNGVYDALRRLYTGDTLHSTSPAGRKQREAAVTAVKEKAAGGNELQRSAALLLLLSMSSEDAAATARAILAEQQQSQWLRIDALQILLLAEPKEKALLTAAPYATDPVLRKVALPFLAEADDRLSRLRGTIYISGRHSSVRVSSGEAIAVTVPAGLDLAALEKIVQEDDADLAAFAGYLLAISGDSGGLEALLSYWQNHKDRQAARMMYRAISKLNDDTHTPALVEVYETLKDGSQYELREMYWTIRPMSGQNVLALRKRMRDELGMQQLR